MRLFPWLRVVTVFSLTAILSFFLLRLVISRDWALMSAFGLAVLSAFLTSRLFRVVLTESIKYPRSFTDLDIDIEEKPKVRTRR